MGASFGKSKTPAVKSTPLQNFKNTQQHPYTENYYELDKKLSELQKDMTNSMNNPELTNTDKLKIHARITEMTLQLNKEFAKLHVNQCARNAKVEGGKKKSTKKQKHTKKTIK